MGNRSGRPFFDGVVCTHLQPALDVVIGIDLGRKTFVDILLTFNDTIIEDVVERGEIVTLVVTTLEGDRMFLTPGGSKYCVKPVGIGIVIVVCLQLCIYGQA